MLKLRFPLARYAGKNGDLRWIEKGGGYYSECNRILSQKVGNAQ